jgi:predicted HTH domain antitoxin
MFVTFQLPDELEQVLRRSARDLNSEAKELLLVGLYRKGEISHGDLSRGLGVDSVTTEEVLHRHGVSEDLGTVEDYLADVETLRKLLDGGG